MDPSDSDQKTPREGKGSILRSGPTPTLSQSKLPIWNINIPNGAVMRIDILDHKTGVCVFEKAWCWSGVSKAEGVCTLIKTFFQISKSLNPEKEDVNQVLFDSTPSKARDRTPSIHTALGTYGRVGLGSTKHKTQQSTLNKSQVIRLVFQKDESAGLICGLFHEVSANPNQIERLNKKILKNFVKKYKEKVLSMRQAFDDIVDEKVAEEVTQQQVIENFSEYTKTVEKFKQSFESKAIKEEAKRRQNENQNQNEIDK